VAHNRCRNEVRRHLLQGAMWGQSKFGVEKVKAKKVKLEGRKTFGGHETEAARR